MIKYNSYKGLFMEIGAPIAAEQAIFRQNLALAVIKSSAQQDQAIAGILEQSAQNLAALTGRGSNVNILV